MSPQSGVEDITALSVAKLRPFSGWLQTSSCPALPPLATLVQLSAHLIPPNSCSALLRAFPTLQGHTKSKLPQQLSWQQIVDSWHTVGLRPLRSVYHLTHCSLDSLWKFVGEIGIPGPRLQREPRRRCLGSGSSSWSHLESGERFASEPWSSPEGKIQLAVFLLGARVNQAAHSQQPAIPTPLNTHCIYHTSTSPVAWKAQPGDRLSSRTHQSWSEVEKLRETEAKMRLRRFEGNFN